MAGEPRHYWTKDSYHCYRLKGDCRRCPIPRLNLESLDKTAPRGGCHVFGILPSLLENYGEPRILPHRNGYIVKGSGEIRTKNRVAEIVDYVKAFPGCTTTQIAKHMHLSEKTIREGLNAALMENELTYTLQPNRRGAGAPQNHWYPGQAAAAKCRRNSTGTAAPF